VSAFWRGAKTLEKLFCREQSQTMKPDNHMESSQEEASLLKKIPAGVGY